MKKVGKSGHIRHVVVTFLVNMGGMSFQIASLDGKQKCKSEKIFTDVSRVKASSREMAN